MIASTLVVGELEGSEEFRSAVRHGRADTWASEHLEQTMKQCDKVDLAGDIVVVRPIHTGHKRTTYC